MWGGGRGHPARGVVSAGGPPAQVAAGGELLLRRVAVDGGGVDVAGEGARLTAEDCAWRNCKKSGRGENGGAVEMKGAAWASFARCEFSKNSAARAAPLPAPCAPAPPPARPQPLSPVL